MSGGQQAGNTYQASNSSSSSGPPSAIEGVLKNMSQAFTNYYLQNPSAPGYYPGSTVAPQSAATQSGLQSLFDAGANNNNALATPASTLNAYAGGQYLDPSTNPYFQQAISYAQQPVIDAFNNQVLPGITGTFEGSGRTPETGNLGGNAVQQATNSLNRNLAGAATTAGANAYQQNQATQLQAAGMIPALQNQYLTNAGAMLQSGQQQDAYQQALTDADVARYNYGSTAQPNWIASLAQQLQGIYPGGQTTGSSNSYGYTMPSTNPFASLLGGGLGLAGLRLQAAQHFSDRRAKTDVEKLGTDPLTGLPMYAYRYKSDPKSYPKVVGPMAQDIEARGGPVREIGGHKAVGMPVGGLL